MEQSDEMGLLFVRWLQQQLQWRTNGFMILLLLVHSYIFTSFINHFTTVDHIYTIYTVKE